MVEKESPSKKKKSESGGGEVMRKTKSFKRIRGFLRGSKKNKAKKEKKEEQKAAQQSKGDEESTVYGVDVDDRSVVSRGTADSSKKGSLLDAAKKKAFLLKVVLLLMDPQTRRFELLQLEFDSLKALVSDVLGQIPLSVTEEALRKQSYSGICGSDGKDMDATKLLADFCKGNEVLVAIPTGVAAKECARLAKPILSDDKVIAMLASSGIDATAWRDGSKKKTKKVETDVAVGETKSEGTPKAASSPKVVTPNVVTPKAAPGSEKKTGSGRATLVVLLFVVFMGILLQVFHMYISSPIKPGNVISPGIWMSKCGLMFFLPSCENAYFSLDKNGKATYADANQDVVWFMEGSVCDEGDESCTPGMEVTVEGNVLIGGKKVNQATMYKDADLSQWPFAEVPSLKLKKHRRSAPDDTEPKLKLL